MSDRTKGLLNISANFEVQSAEGLDSRCRVKTKSSLMLLDTWKSSDNNVYTYVGMVVSVYNDTDLINGLYRLKSDDYTQESNWIKVSGDPYGNDTEIQINKANSLYSTSSFTYNYNTNVLNVYEVSATTYYGDGSHLTGLVATLSGLTDVTLNNLVTGEVLIYSGNSWKNNTLDFNYISNKPTTISGYGITDASLSSHTHTQFDNNLTINGYLNIQNVNSGSSASELLTIKTDGSVEKVLISSIVGNESGKTWLQPVNGFSSYTSCNSSGTVVRYISSETLSGWTINNVYQCNGDGLGWVETLVNSGDTVVNLTDNKIYVFGLSGWTVSTSQTAPLWGTSGIDIINLNTGLVKISKDALINGIIVGRGGGNISYNTAFGANVLLNNISSKWNVGIGVGVFSSLTGGSGDNVGIGYNTMEFLTSGSKNVGVGQRSLRNLTIGTGNTAIGDNSLNGNITGSTNIGIGYYAGYRSTSSNELYIDNTQPFKYGRDTNYDEKANAIIYGQMGVTSTQRLYFNVGRLGINTNGSATTAKLHIHENSNANNYIKLTNNVTTTGVARGLDIGVTTSANKAIFWNYENTNIALATNNTERITITSGGTVGINTTTPITINDAQGGLDVSCGQLSLIIGADNNLRTRTDLTNKNARFGMAHYINSEEPMSLLFGQSFITQNILNVGGGSINMNAATDIKFFTASSNTNVVGVERMFIDSVGTVYMNGNVYVNNILSATTLQGSLDWIYLTNTSHTHTKSMITDFVEGDYVHTTGNENIFGNKSFNGDVTVRGNVYISGTATTIYSENLAVKDNLIVINSGETNSGVTKGFAGISIDRGTLTNYVFIFDENQGNFRIGQTNSPTANTQAVATREDSPNSSGISFWDSINYRFNTSNKLTWDGNTFAINTTTPNTGMTLDVNGYGNFNGAVFANEFALDGNNYWASGNIKTTGIYINSSSITSGYNLDINGSVLIRNGSTLNINDYSLPLSKGLNGQYLTMSANTTYWSTIDLSPYYTSSQTNANFLSANTFNTIINTNGINNIGNITASTYYGDGSHLTGLVATLSGLTDVSLNNLVSGNTIIYSGGSWKNGMYDWSYIINKPTTISGYGITDAVLLTVYNTYTGITVPNMFNNYYTTAQTYTRMEMDNRYVNVTGDTMTGDLTISTLSGISSLRAVYLNSSGTLIIGDEIGDFYITATTIITALQTELNWNGSVYIGGVDITSLSNGQKYIDSGYTYEYSNSIMYRNSSSPLSTGTTFFSSNYYTKTQTNVNFVSASTYNIYTGTTVPSLIQGVSNTLTAHTSLTGYSNPHQTSFNDLVSTAHTHLWTDINNRYVYTNLSSNTILDSFSILLTDGCIWNYVIKDGVNVEAGTIIGVWDYVTLASTYTQYSTDSLGNTNAVTFNIDINNNNIRLLTNITSGNWNIKIRRLSI